MDPHATASPAPILAAFSPGKSLREPVDFGLAASEVTGAPLIVVNVRRGGPLADQFASVDDSVGDDEQGLEHLRLDLHRNRTPADIEAIDARTVTGGLSRAVEKHKPQLLVLGSSKRGTAGSVLLGGTAERILHESPCPIAVVPKGYKRPEKGVQLIGVAYSTTPEGREALEVAVTMARRGHVRLRAITVHEGNAEQQSPGLMAEQHHDAAPEGRTHAQHRLDVEAELKAALEELAQGVETEIDVLAEDPGDALIAASRHVDLLVMGSRARGARRAVVLGSVSRKVIAGAACPVLVLPRGATEMSRQLASSVRTGAPE
jgi:nucleotide-binding universal stress UspA family protein